jgi:ankyrin repeat protein
MRLATGKGSSMQSSEGSRWWQKPCLCSWWGHWREVDRIAQACTIPMSHTILDRISNGRTDLVFDFLSAGLAAASTDSNGVSLIKWCAYYGDVSAIRFLLGKGESLTSLGSNLDLNGAAFHGHWQLCQFLIENGAGVNSRSFVMEPFAFTRITSAWMPICWEGRMSNRGGRLGPNESRSWQSKRI